MNDASWRWTEERVELLKKLWTAGESASQVAARMGNGITREAVCGKVNRLVHAGDLAPRGDPNGENRTMRKRGKTRPTPWRAKQVGGKRPPPPVIFEADGYTSTIEDFIPLKQRKTVVTLERDDCRWPIGDPQKSDFHFCGAEKVAGLPYCPSHARRAFPNIELVTLESVDEDIKEMENV